MHRIGIAALIWLVLLANTARAAQQVNLLGMGDWGNGSPAQKQVAESMADFVQKSAVPFNAVLLAGDNFYGRLTGTNDSRWYTDFETEYDAKTLKFPFFATAWQ